MKFEEDIYDSLCVLFPDASEIDKDYAATMLAALFFDQHNQIISAARTVVLTYETPTTVIGVVDQLPSEGTKYKAVDYFMDRLGELVLHV